MSTRTRPSPPSVKRHPQRAHRHTSSPPFPVNLGFDRCRCHLVRSRALHAQRPRLGRRLACMEVVSTGVRRSSGTAGALPEPIKPERPRPVLVVSVSIPLLLQVGHACWVGCALPRSLGLGEWWSCDAVHAASLMLGLLGLLLLALIITRTAIITAAASLRPRCNIT
jgi:hypothetical protein